MFVPVIEFVTAGIVVDVVAVLVVVVVVVVVVDVDVERAERDERQTAS